MLGLASPPAGPLTVVQHPSGAPGEDGLSGRAALEGMEERPAPVSRGDDGPAGRAGDLGQIRAMLGKRYRWAGTLGRRGGSGTDSWSCDPGGKGSGVAEVPCPGSPLLPPRCATLTEPQLHPLSALGCGDKTALLQNAMLRCVKD